MKKHRMMTSSRSSTSSTPSPTLSSCLPLTSRSNSSVMSTAKRSVASTSATRATPIWRKYLALRSPSDHSQLLAANHSKSLPRKRSKPGGGRVRTTLEARLDPPVPLLDAPLSSASLEQRVRIYWQALSAQERQQILLVDDPEIVKQLYKINLSLLCVGLLQRHLKTSHAIGKGLTMRRPSSTSSTSSSASPASSSCSTASSSSSLSTSVSAASTTTNLATPSSSSSSEDSYELLEAMEFMDIDTGILTVKSELVDDWEQLFALLAQVLSGFLSSFHLLSAAQFQELFVVESERIASWDEYQMLLAMLIEQLLLKNYTRYLEAEATKQMQELLLVEEKEQLQQQQKLQPRAKNKKKNRKKRVVAQPKNSAAEKDENDKSVAMTESQSHLPDNDSNKENTQRLPLVQDQTSQNDCKNEPVFGVDVVIDEPERRKAQGREHETASNLKEITSEAEPRDDLTAKHLGTRPLNPSASVFTPETIRRRLRFESERGLMIRDGETDANEVQSPANTTGKRKLDQFLIELDAEDFDLSQDHEELEALHGRDFDFSMKSSRHEEVLVNQMAEREQQLLRLQLHQMYCSTSQLYGWDFVHQRDLPAIFRMDHERMEWSANDLFKTMPEQVVRYFSPPSSIASCGSSSTALPEVVHGFPGLPPRAMPLPHQEHFVAPPQVHPSPPTRGNPFAFALPPVYFHPLPVGTSPDTLSLATALAPPAGLAPPPPSTMVNSFACPPPPWTEEAIHSATATTSAATPPGT